MYRETPPLDKKLIENGSLKLSKFKKRKMNP